MQDSTAAAAGSSTHQPAMRDDSDDGDFEFAFKSPIFSDRTLRIEIATDPVPSRKRPRDEETGTNDKVDPSEAPLRVESIGISSVILAKKSQFFLKLFTNGMQESNQQCATLRVNASEEAALMELLRIMYGGSISSTCHAFLLDLLTIADKFEVPSCINHCVLHAMTLPMTTKSALLYLDLSPALMMLPALEPLVNAAKETLANKYKKIMAVPRADFLALPLEGIEEIFDWDDLAVPGEDAVLNLLCMWAGARYCGQPQEYREVFNRRLLPLVRFAFMSCKRLRKLLKNPWLDKEVSLERIMEALLFKAESPHDQYLLQAADRRFMERAYTRKPVKVVELAAVLPQCIVYLDLRRAELEKLFPRGDIRTQDIHLGGQKLNLQAGCSMDGGANTQGFGLYLTSHVQNLRVACEFAAMLRTAEDFTCKVKMEHCFNKPRSAIGFPNFFRVPWATFMADDCPYFVDGILRLRAHLTIKNPGI